MKPKWFDEAKAQASLHVHKDVDYNRWWTGVCCYKSGRLKADEERENMKLLHEISVDEYKLNITGLNKEIERLKGLIEKAFGSSAAWIKTGSIYKHKWAKFKTENNL